MNKINIRKSFLILLIGILAVALLLFISHQKIIGGNRSKSSVVIIMDDNGFMPDSMTIKKGERVVFENKGKEAHWPASNIHPTHLIYPEFDPKNPIKPGENWEFIFQKVGIWRFHDHLFPDFTGSVVVTE